MSVIPPAEARRSAGRAALPTPDIDPVDIGEPEEDNERPDWMGSLAFMMVHAACLFVFVVGWSWTAVGTAVALYFVRMFGITAGFHRYFSHRSYKTSRWFQFCMAFLGTSSAQQGPLWWAAHHRHHHRHSDQPEDIHSPIEKGFFWAHVGWIMSRKYEKTDTKAIPDMARFPELRFLDDYHIIPPICLATAVFVAGVLLNAYAPGLGTNGGQMLVWGFFVSTVFLYHGTFTINSLSHVIGTRRFETTDHSRNNFFLALITMGEGWHNNHHRWHNSERQGFYWWEIDMSHYILKAMSMVGLVWDLQTPPKKIYDEAQSNAPLPALRRK